MGIRFDALYASTARITMPRDHTKGSAMSSSHLCNPRARPSAKSSRPNVSAGCCAATTAPRPEREQRVHSDSSILAADNPRFGRLGARRHECYHWAAHGGAELDLLIVRWNRRLGFEAKLTEAPTLTKSMHIALQDLHLSQFYVVHAGAGSSPPADHAYALAAVRIAKECRPLPG